MSHQIKTPDKIRQPCRVKPCKDSAFVDYFYEDAQAEHVLVRGAFAFPRFDKRIGKYQGALSLCTMNPDTEKIKLLYVDTFDFYTFRFWSLIKRIAEKYGTNSYYFNHASYEDKQKLVAQAMREMNRGKQYEYPILCDVTLSSDSYAYETLFQKISEGNFSYSAKSDFLTASIFWDEEKSFSEAPAELQAVCLNVYGLERDILHYEQKENELNEQ